MKTSRMFTARAPAPVVVRLLALLLALVLAPAARGQGMMGMLPEPISSADLMQYAERLDLSDAQWPAIEAAHDAYKQRYQEFRDTTVADLMRRFSGMSMMMGDRDSVKKSLDRLDDAFQSVANLDRRFFDELQPVLSETQVAALQRVRDLRERQRYRSMPLMMMAMGGTQLIDVSELFYSLDLPAPHRAQADPLVEQYERRMTAEMRELRKISTETMLEFFRVAVVEAGTMGDDSPPDGADEADDNADPDEAARRLQEAQRDRMERMQQAYETVMAAPVKKLRELRDINRSAVRQVASALPEVSARQFKLEYDRAEMPQLAYSLLHAYRWTAEMRTWDDVAPAELDAVEAAANAYLVQVDPVVEKLIDLNDRINGERSIFSFNANPDQELWQKFSDAQQQLTTMGIDAVKALNDALGEERSRRLVMATDENASGWLDNLVATDQPQADQAVADAETEFDETWSGDEYLPIRITHAALPGYAEQLDLDAGQRAVLDTLFDDYAARHRRIAEEKIAPISEMPGRLWQFDGDETHVVEPDDRFYSKMTELRRTAMQAILDNDRDFFDQLEVAFVQTDEQADALRSVRQARVRAAWNGDSESMINYYDPSGGAAGRVDLLAVIRDLGDEIDLPADAVAGPFQSYAKESLDLYQRRFDQSLAMAESQLRYMVASQRLRQEGTGAVFDYQRLYQEYLAEPQKKLREITSSIAALNRSTMDALADTLDDASAERLRDAVRRAAYPNVYEDPLAVHDQLSAALGLDDLRPDQRRTLDDLAVEYRADYDACCNALIDVFEAQQSMNLMDVAEAQSMDAERQQALAQRFMKLQQDQDKARFGRAELNARTIRKLRTLLNPDQVRRIGGLPDPAEQKSDRFPF